MKILFIDDDVLFNAEFVAYLRYVKNWDIVQKTTPKDGMEYIKNNNFDLLLLDIMMPTDNSIDEQYRDDGGNTGIHLLEKMYDTLVSKKIPTLVYTARGNSILTQLERFLGVKYIRKSASLANVIDKMIEVKGINPQLN